VVTFEMRKVHGLPPDVVQRLAKVLGLLPDVMQLPGEVVGRLGEVAGPLREVMQLPGEMVGLAREVVGLSTDAVGPFPTVMQFLTIATRHPGRMSTRPSFLVILSAAKDLHGTGGP
jgi:hypothetical protein